MPQINVARREISCKLVYYGPGLSGKTTNLEVIHKKAPESKTGPLTNVATQGDRTLFFDFMALDLGTVGGLAVKLQLYTVPGQAYYRATRRLVLQGVDGVVFVADSQPDKQAENLESLRDLTENLREQGVELREVPHVIQWNKRDMPGALSVEELDERLNAHAAPSFEAVAVTGEGVFPTLRMLAQLVLEDLRKKFGVVPAAGDSGPSRRRGGVPRPKPPQRPAPREEPSAFQPPTPATSEQAPASPVAPPANQEQSDLPRVRGTVPGPVRRRPGRLVLVLALLALGVALALGQQGRLPAQAQTIYERAVSLWGALLQ